MLGGEADAADDVSEIAWFGPDELPPDGRLAFHIAEVTATWRQQHRGARGSTVNSSGVASSAGSALRGVQPAARRFDREPLAGALLHEPGRSPCAT